MIIETHAHLDFPEYNKDRNDVIKRAKGVGVEAIVNVASSLEGSRASVKLAGEHDSIYACCGIHPHDAKEVTDEAIAELKNLASSQRVVAIGEVGFDFYRNLSPKDLQIEAFGKFLKLSKELGLPVILHCREAGPGEKEAADLIFKALAENFEPPFKAVMHCFSGNEELLKRCLDSGMLVSYTCNVTFKKADKLREVVKSTPIDRLMLETDSPFLSPQAKRGERNEPAYLVYLVDAMAEILGVSKEEVEETTTRTAKNFFNI